MRRAAIRFTIAVAVAASAVSAAPIVRVAASSATSPTSSAGGSAATPAATSTVSTPLYPSVCAAPGPGTGATAVATCLQQAPVSSSGQTPQSTPAAPTGNSWAGASAIEPNSRDYAASAFDAATDQVVLYGGASLIYNQTNLATDVPITTYTWSNGRWKQEFPPTQPPALAEASMAYDATSHKVVLFGGQTCAPSAALCTASAQTWLWDGDDWMQAQPATSPPGRELAQMATDPHGGVLLFGGFEANPQPVIGTGGTVVNDTWKWDGTNWAQLSPAHVPPIRDAAGMADDPATGQVVLYGGGGGSVGLSDTWTWDGTDWTQQNPATDPGARDQDGMAYDSTSGRVLLFGGDDTSTGQVVGDTWAWDGAQWTQLQPVLSPPARIPFGGVSADGNGVLLFGGFSFASLVPLDDTWTFGAGTWTELPHLSPQNRLAGAMVYDPATRSDVLFSGYGCDGRFYCSDTWIWDGARWAQDTVSTVPMGRSEAGAAYVGRTGDVVTFGGVCANATYCGDTWTWDGATWKQQQPASSPGARFGDRMAGDANGNAIMFGGYPCGTATSFCGDTWIWNGAAWAQQPPPLNPAAAPQPRAFEALAYDPATRTTVLFGGSTEVCGVVECQTVLLDDTWTWDGTTWSLQAPAVSPVARQAATMAYEPALGELVLFGGGDGQQALSDTWAWNGATWTQLSAGQNAASQNADQPLQRLEASMDTDPNGGVVLFGGLPGYIGWQLNDTWTLGSQLSARVPESPVAPLLVVVAAAGVGASVLRRRHRR